MRTTIVLSLTVAAIAGSAFAQGRVSTKPPSTAPSAIAEAAARENDPEYRRFERQLTADLDRRKAQLARTGVLSDVAAVEPAPPPGHWRGSMEAWRTHMARCRERYQSYDAETDTFIASPGVTRRCGL